MEMIENPISGNTDETKISVKEPKKVLHFSDGIIEEYSEDENDSSQDERSKVKPEAVVDPVSRVLT